MRALDYANPQYSFPASGAGETVTPTTYTAVQDGILVCFMRGWSKDGTHYYWVEYNASITINNTSLPYATSNTSSDQRLIFYPISKDDIISIKYYTGTAIIFNYL